MGSHSFPHHNRKWSEIWRSMNAMLPIRQKVRGSLVLPLAIITLTRGLKGRFARHRAIARWTFPIWLYVSVTGVLVYVLLYQPTWLL